LENHLEVEKKYITFALGKFLKTENFRTWKEVKVFQNGKLFRFVIDKSFPKLGTFCRMNGE